MSRQYTQCIKASITKEDCGSMLTIEFPRNHVALRRFFDNQELQETAKLSLAKTCDGLDWIIKCLQENEAGGHKFDGKIFNSIIYVGRTENTMGHLMFVFGGDTSVEMKLQLSRDMDILSDFQQLKDTLINQ